VNDDAARASKAVPRGVTNSLRVRERCRQTPRLDVAGRAYIDFASGHLEVLNTGHLHPKVQAGARAGGRWKSCNMPASGDSVRELICAGGASETRSPGRRSQEDHIFFS